LEFKASALTGFPKAKALDSKKRLKLKLWTPKKTPKAKALDSKKNA
jgi:hypothetical protein